MNMGFPRTLKLSHVPRWVIVDMMKDQTVADHTFRVMVIFNELAKRLGVKEDDIAKATVKILYHDSEESVTGDIPSTRKVHNIPKNTPLIDVMIKLCDSMEAYTYAGRYAVKPKQVERFMTNQISSCIAYLSTRHIHIQSVFDEMVADIESYC